MLDWLRGDRRALSKFAGQPKHLPGQMNLYSSYSFDFRADFRCSFALPRWAPDSALAGSSSVADLWSGADLVPFWEAGDLSFASTLVEQLLTATLAREQAPDAIRSKVKVETIDGECFAERLSSSSNTD